MLLGDPVITDLKLFNTTTTSLNNISSASEVMFINLISFCFKYFYSNFLLSSFRYDNKLSTIKTFGFSNKSAKILINTLSHIYNE